VRRRGRPRFPVSEISRHSNGEPACAGRTPPAGIAQQVGSAKPRTHARRRWFNRWRLSDIRRMLRLPAHINGGRTHGSYALSLRSKRPADGNRGLQEAGAGVMRVTCVPVVAMGPDQHHPLKLAFSCWFRQSATLLWTLHSGGSLARPQSAARIARSEDAGDGGSSRRCLTAAGASRFPLTGRSRRDSIRALAATGQTSSPHRCW
jgi:hypothetical protein